MKQYTIILDNDLSSVYEEIAKICDKSTEEIFQETLHKVFDMLSGRLRV